MATYSIVKMAAYSPTDGESVSDNITYSSGLQPVKLSRNNSQAKCNHSLTNSRPISLDGEKAYDTVANFEEGDLRNLLEEVISIKQSKNDKSAIAQILIRKEEDALREESGSGEDTIELIRRQKKKRPGSKRDHYISGSSAASRNNTGGSLGSLHDLSEPKLAHKKTSSTTQGVASRSRAGGSCGNLSKGSFETRVCKRKSRRSKELVKASASQREGGSLQNLSKPTIASGDSKRLHKSGSLSQVFSDIRIKNRRHKTSSESSSNRLHRRSEDRDPDSSEDELVGIPYQPLSSFPHSSVNRPDVSVTGMISTYWNGDRLSDAASGETTEDDGEMTRSATRSKLVDASRHHYSHSLKNDEESDTKLHIITTHRDVLPTISSDSDVDKPINYDLNKSQDEPMASGTYLMSHLTSMMDAKSAMKDDEGDRRRLRGTRSDSSFERSALDENGNPVRPNISCNSSSSSGSISSLQTSGNERHITSLPVMSKRNGLSAQNKDISTYEKLKAKADKKKANKEKDVIAIEKTPGFRGDHTLASIFKYLGVDDSANNKAKKKKGKKEDEKEGTKKNKGGKGNEKEVALMFDQFQDYCEGMKTQKEEEPEMKKANGKRGGKDNEKRKERKVSGLRESSSMEDLVSKSRQSDNIKDVRKQMTVDDGDVSFSVEEPQSEFSYDFYRVGDTTLDSSLTTTGEIGDFELVNRRKGKKSKNNQTVSQETKYGGSGGLNGNLMPGNVYVDDQRRSTFPRTNVFSNRSSQTTTSSQEKTELNFSEVPRTMHEGTFISNWGGMRSGSRERGFPSTTSAPHSEDSDSDGGDSVHSMPAHATPSAESTPQTSYAKIAKLASSTNSSKMPGKKGNSVTSHSCSSDGERTTADDAESLDSKNDSRGNVLDDNFPPLAEVHGSSPSPKSGEKDATEPSPETSVKKEARSPKTNPIEASSASLKVDKPASALPNDTVVPIANGPLSSVLPTNSIPNSKPLVPNSQPVQKTPTVPPQKAPLPSKPLTNVSKPLIATSSDRNSENMCDNVAKAGSDKVLSDQSKSAAKTSKQNRNPSKEGVLVNSISKENAIVENGNVWNKRFEEAVIFTDSAMFDHGVTDIEFGFDLSLDNLTTCGECEGNNNSEMSDVITNATIPADNPNSERDNRNVKNLQTSKKDYSKLFQAPKDDVISNNYEELCKHISKAWESTLRMLEEDPKNIQYWKAAESTMDQ